MPLNVAENRCMLDKTIQEFGARIIQVMIVVLLTDSQNNLDCVNIPILEYSQLD